MVFFFYKFKELGLEIFWFKSNGKEKIFFYGYRTACCSFFFFSFLEGFRSGKKIFVRIWNIENGFFFYKFKELGLEIFC